MHPSANAVTFPDPNMRQLCEFVGAEHMKSHGAKSSYMLEAQRIPLQRDQLVLHTAFHIGVIVAQTR